LIRGGDPFYRVFLTVQGDRTEEYGEKGWVDMDIVEQKILALKRKAAEIRITTLEVLGNLGFGHVGGSMSVTELLTALYFGDVMRHDPKNPGWEDRDWLVMSKGHAGPTLYTILAMRGFFPMSELETLNRGGTHLPSHCDRNLTPGVDMTTGSLGLGMSVAIGVALGHRLEGKKNRVYLIVGDGECQEGQVWEAILYAAQKDLHRLIAFVDYNHQQLDGYTKDINDLGDLRGKFECFGWHALEVDGHDFSQIFDAVGETWEERKRPSVIVMNTIKGKGCTYAEGVLKNHHMVVTEENTREAIECLRGELGRLETAARG
jgi:transketolase